MTHKVTILGSGAATGVPSISSGWGKCNPNNLKNKRRRAGIYVDMDDTKILIDTSADLREQLLDNNIKHLDGVLYTHTHADHLHGIDDLRGINRVMQKSLTLYGIQEHITEIRERMSYVLADQKPKEVTHRPLLYTQIIEYGQELQIGSVHIMPLEACGHSVRTTAYCINSGEVVIIPDYMYLPDNTLAYLKQINIQLLIMPLTIPQGLPYHAGLTTDLMYADQLKAKHIILTHMASECDYDEINRQTPDNIEPAYDNMIIELS